MTLQEIQKIVRTEGRYEAFVHEGLQCRMIRNLHDREVKEYSMFHWCGYVGVPEGHPAYQKENFDVEVHGGVTYSNMGLHMQPEKNLWWIGFDCARLGDVYMVMEGMSGFSDTYKDKTYVMSEVKQLAEQLAKLNREVIAEVEMPLIGKKLTVSRKKK